MSINTNRTPSNLADASMNTTNSVGSTPTAEAPKPIDVVNGTNTHCGKYHRVGTNDECSSLTFKYGISLSHFYFLSPEIIGDCQNLQLNGL